MGRFPLGKRIALPNGICRYLDQTTNLCTIYENRPWFCNIDAYYEQFIKGKMSREDFYTLNQIECRRLQKQADNDKSEMQIIKE